MKHVQHIEALIETLVKSENFHALLIQSAPGWSKSTTIDNALRRIKLPFVTVGSYTTPLHFYNTIVEHPRSILVVDDSAGLFNDGKTMALLKSATWPSVGGDSTSSSRRVSWGSTSDKVLTPTVDFSGKIILLTNTLPQGKETQAFLTRCLSYRISFTEAEIKKMLLSAVESNEYFKNLSLARAVAKFLVHPSLNVDFSQLNLRTLRLGYELATTQPEHWKELLPNLLPRASSKMNAGKMPSLDSTLPVKRLENSFISSTGMSRRTFYYQRKKAGLSRSYRAKSSD
jgi:hypothetical protein